MGRPEILDVGGDAGDSFTNFRIARATITMKACHLKRVVAISVLALGDRKILREEVMLGRLKLQATSLTDLATAAT